jgi:rhodanese-related sulfurtransferase
MQKYDIESHKCKIHFRHSRRVRRKCMEGDHQMVQTITRDDLKAKLDRGARVTLVEALPAKYYEDKHLPGAINMPHDEVDALAPRLLPDKAAEIVVYCASGPCKNSGIAARRLAETGYTNVRDYHEGKADWIEAGYPVESGAANQAA